MSIIEGVGDEVTIFVTIFFILTGLILAWLTTTLSPETHTVETDVLNQSTHENDESENGASESSGQQQGDPPDETANGTRNRFQPELNRQEPSVENSQDSANQNNSSTAEGETDLGAGTATEPSERLDGHIRLKIKYLDDRERFVQVRPEENVESFKRTHFAGELAENLLVRLIYNGQELRGESSTLSSYNIGDMSVVHCLITRSTRPQEGNGQVDQDTMEIDLSNLMFPLFGLILGLIWYCRIAYRNFFNAMSTLALIGITVLFFFACVITLRNNRPHEHFPPQAQHMSDGHQHQE